MGGEYHTIDSLEELRLDVEALRQERVDAISGRANSSRSLELKRALEYRAKKHARGSVLQYVLQAKKRMYELVEEPYRFTERYCDEVEAAIEMMMGELRFAEEGKTWGEVKPPSPPPPPPPRDTKKVARPEYTFESLGMRPTTAEPPVNTHNPPKNDDSNWAAGHVQSQPQWSPEMPQAAQRDVTAGGNDPVTTKQDAPLPGRLAGQHPDDGRSYGFTSDTGPSNPFLPNNGADGCLQPSAQPTGRGVPTESAPGGSNESSGQSSGHSKKQSVRSVLGWPDYLRLHARGVRQDSGSVLSPLLMVKSLWLIWQKKNPAIRAVRDWIFDDGMQMPEHVVIGYFSTCGAVGYWRGRHWLAPYMWSAALAVWVWAWWIQIRSPVLRLCCRYSNY